MNPNHYQLRETMAFCSICGEKNPLGSLHKLSLQEVNTPSEIIVCFTQSGKAAHGLHLDAKTALGPRVSFTSGETLDRAETIEGPCRQKQLDVEADGSASIY